MSFFKNTRLQIVANLWEAQTMQENYKILVVDDDMRLRALLERYLTEQGFQVRSVYRRTDGSPADS
ncbi:hypothetical protein ACLK2I_18700 [Escherichia coli]